MIQLDRTQAPSFQLSSNYSLTKPEVFQFPNGNSLYAFRQLQQEAVKLELIFNAGKWFEPVLGVSHFTSQMLVKGTKNKDSFQIAEGLDSLGAHLEISPGFDVVSLSLFSIRKNLLSALRLVIEMLEEPSFDENELRLMKEIFIQGLKINNEKTSVIASKEIRKAVFGNDHPYGSSVEESDVDRIHVDALRSFFQDNFVPQSGILVGRLSDEEVREVARIIPNLSVDSRTAKHFNRVAGVSQKIPKAGSVQASIRMGKKCLPKGDNEAYAEAVLSNHVLGGFFGSRLMKNIREEKGLTYGIYSSMHHFLNDSFWTIGAEVNQQNTEIAIKEISKEIQRLQEVPMSIEELEIARNYFIGSWQSENSTLFSVAEKFKNIQLWGLSEDYYSHLLTRIQNISPAQVQHAANLYFDVSDLCVVQVG